MADYLSHYRADPFHVTDETAYNELIKRFGGDDVEFWTEKDQNGATLHGICGTGPYYFYEKDMHMAPWGSDEDDDSCDAYDNIAGFIRELQPLLPNGEVFSFTESGHEKLRYISDYCYVANNKQSKYMNLYQFKEETIHELQNNER